MKSIGIDIGQFSIKVVELDIGTRTIAVTRMEEFALSQDPNKDHRIEVIDYLRQIGARYEPGTVKMVTSVPQNSVAVRKVTFPFKERYKILKSLAFELEDDIPFSQEDSIFDAKVVEYSSRLTNCLAVACPKVRIEDLIQLSRDCGFEWDIISVEGLAFSNLFENWLDAPPDTGGGQRDRNDEDDDETATQNLTTPLPGSVPGEVIVDIGHQFTTLIFRKENSVIDVRSIDWGGTDVAKAISKKYSIHIVEGLRELKSKGFILTTDEGATRDQKVFSDVIKSSLDDLARELQLLIYDVSSELGLDVQKGVMVGGTCQIKNIGPYLTQKLKIPFNRLKSIAQHPQLDFITNKQNEVVMGTALGLAIEGVKKAKNPPINLLKDDFARQSQTLRRFWDKWNHAVHVSIAMFIVFFIYAWIYESLAVQAADESVSQLKIQAKNVTGGKLKGRSASPKKIRRYIRDKKKEAKNRKLAEKVGKLNSTMDVLKLITNSIPSKKQIRLDIRKLRVENDEVFIEGQVAQARSVNTIMSNLKNIAVGGRVNKLRPTIRATRGASVFGLQFKVDRTRSK